MTVPLVTRVPLYVSRIAPSVCKRSFHSLTTEQLSKLDRLRLSSIAVGGPNPTTTEDVFHFDRAMVASARKELANVLGITHVHKSITMSRFLHYMEYNVSRAKTVLALLRINELADLSEDHLPYISRVEITNGNISVYMLKGLWWRGHLTQGRDVL